MKHYSQAKSDRLLVKGCKKSQEAGLSPGSIKVWIFQEVEKILGEIKAGERER